MNCTLLHTSHAPSGAVACRRRAWFPAQALLLPCVFVLALAAPAASQPVRMDSCFKPLLLQLQQRVLLPLRCASTACSLPLANTVSLS